MGEATTPQTVKVKLSIPGGGSLERRVSWTSPTCSPGRRLGVDYITVRHGPRSSVPARDGDTRSVALNILNDALCRGNEDVAFRLGESADARRKVSVAIPGQHMVTIGDDDAYA